MQRFFVLMLLSALISLAISACKYQYNLYTSLTTKCQPTSQHRHPSANVPASTIVPLSNSAQIVHPRRTNRLPRSSLLEAFSSPALQATAGRPATNAIAPSALRKASHFAKAQRRRTSSRLVSSGIAGRTRLLSCCSLRLLWGCWCGLG